MRGVIQLRMIDPELIHNNNLICIFSRKLNYFCSTSAITDFRPFSFSKSTAGLFLLEVDVLRYIWTIIDRQR